jgi:hypothetical protein
MFVDLPEGIVPRQCSPDPYDTATGAVSGLAERRGAFVQYCRRHGQERLTDHPQSNL